MSATLRWKGEGCRRGRCEDPTLEGALAGVGPPSEALRQRGSTEEHSGTPLDTPQTPARRGEKFLGALEVEGEALAGGR